MEYSARRVKGEGKREKGERRAEKPKGRTTPFVLPFGFSLFP
jgi:hypothetical protein